MKKYIILLLLIQYGMLYSQTYRKYIKSETTEIEEINDSTRTAIISAGPRFYLTSDSITYTNIDNKWIDRGSYFSMTKNSHSLYIKKNILNDSAFIFINNNKTIVLEPLLILYNNNIQSGYVKPEWQKSVRSSVGRITDSNIIRFDSCFGPGIHIEAISSNEGFKINKIFDSGVIYLPPTANYLDIVFKINTDDDLIESNGKKWNKISTDTNISYIKFSKISNKYNLRSPSIKNHNGTIKPFTTKSQLILKSNGNTKLLIKRISEINNYDVLVTDVDIGASSSARWLFTYGNNQSSCNSSLLTSMFTTSPDITYGTSGDWGNISDAGAVGYADYGTAGMYATVGMYTFDLGTNNIPSNATVTAVTCSVYVTSISTGGYYLVNSSVTASSYSSRYSTTTAFDHSGYFYWKGSAKSYFGYSSSTSTGWQTMSVASGDLGNLVLGGYNSIVITPTNMYNRNFPSCGNAMNAALGDGSNTMKLVISYTSSNPPTVTTNNATLISSTTALLNGTVNANESSTTVTFEYGTTTSYGTTVTATQSPVTGASNTSVSAFIQNLIPNSIYYFRVVGSNVGGTANGSNNFFRTLNNKTNQIINMKTP